MNKTGMEEELRIIVDHRELKSGVVKELFRNDVRIVTEQLAIGDFILGEHVVCERKGVEDFVNSLLDGRLFKQAAQLKDAYKKPFLIIEGGRDMYAVRNVHANAIRGALASLALDFSLPLIFTKDEKDTAQLLITILKRERANKQANLRGAPKPLTNNELMEYIISSFPSVGRRTARNILTHFKTIHSFVASEKEELTRVEGVGDITAERIFSIIRQKYE